MWVRYLNTAMICRPFQSRACGRWASSRLRRRRSSSSSAMSSRTSASICGGSRAAARGRGLDARRAASGRGRCGCISTTSFALVAVSGAEFGRALDDERQAARGASDPEASRHAGEQRVVAAQASLWGKMERRSRLEAALRECEFRVAQRGSPRKTKTIVDPCDEPDFEAPKRPWPRSKAKLFEPLIADGDVFEAACIAGAC